MLKNRHILFLTWLFGGTMLLMAVACSSSDDEGGQGVDKKSATLAVYVYAPEQAAAKKKGPLTRGDVGEVDAITNEGTINSLQIWIYESESGDYVGYFNTEDVTALNQGQGTTYQLPVSDDFANKEPKPNVNVYVMANVKAENCGVGTLDKGTSRSELIAGAKITGHFGLSDLQTSVPTDGLPMAGMLTLQPVVGDAPALRVGNLSQVSTVQLTRAVSKLRFVFSKTKDQPTVSITSIKIDEGMIPNVEYLFDKPESVTIDYNTSASELKLSDINDIAETTDPTDYIYLNQDAQEYEDLIDGAGLTVNGPIYLRESDKQLVGTITYKIADGEEQIVDFQMQQAGDFLRNHTWIVYAYYAGSGKLRVQTVYVKNWENRNFDYEFFNW